MLIAIMTILFLGGGSNTFLDYIAEAKGEVKTVVLDDERRKAALATLKLMKKEASARNKSTGKLSKLIAKQVKVGGPTSSELGTAWSEHYETVDGYYARMIDLRFELRDSITREEWQQIFAAKESEEQ
jgi:hypothetical protein